MHLAMSDVRAFLIPLLAIILSSSITSKATSVDSNTQEQSQCTCDSPVFSRPIDCEEVRLNGHNVSGLYTIYPRSRTFGCKSMQVYCDMHTAGGGWTVLQRRGDFGSAYDYFHKEWEYYKRGFGAVEREFWIGNDNLFAITNQGSYSVRFDLRHSNGTSAYAHYEKFWIDDESQKYKLHISGYSGTAGDAMSYHNNRMFYTRDRDNSNNCAKNKTGGWWFESCLLANLNGLRINGSTSGKENGIEWYSFGGSYNSKVFSEIKIRPNNFQ